MDRYTVRGVAIVGISPQGNGDLWTEARINNGYSDSGGRLFYLQGGYAPEKLGFIHRMMMKSMATSVIRQVAAKGDGATDQERQMAEVFRSGGDSRPAGGSGRDRPVVPGGAPRRCGEVRAQGGVLRKMKAERPMPGCL